MEALPGAAVDSLFRRALRQLLPRLIPTYFCAKLAAENGVRVLLAYDGGDELFGGQCNVISVPNKIETVVSGCLLRCERRSSNLDYYLQARPTENGKPWRQDAQRARTSPLWRDTSAAALI